MTRSRLTGWSFCVLACGLAVGCGQGPAPDAEKPRKAARNYFGIQQVPRAPGAELPVEVTPRAVVAVRKVLSEMDEPGGCYLRLSGTPGGCTGLILKLDLDPIATGEDVVFESNGVKIAVAQKQLELLRGSLIDYGEEKGQTGFKITNPKREAEAANKPCPVPE